MPQELMLALEVRSREHRPRLRAADKEVTVEVLEEARGGAAAIVARLRRRHRRSVNGFAALAHAACLAWLRPTNAHSSRTPPLGTLTARIDPPCRLVTAATSASPSPVPVPRVRAWSAR